MKERAAREASGQKSAPPCPRCGTALNAMNGCDVCGYPGEADFR
jgi:ribosomal protein L37E